MKEAMVLETPLIGSGSQEEADKRVNILLEMGTSRGFLTYEELNEKLPDEVVSPDKLDSLLMRIDEMGIKLIDEFDVADYQKGGKKKPAEPAPVIAPVAAPAAPAKKHSAPKPILPAKEPLDGEHPGEIVDEDEELDLSLEEEIAEAATKRIDDPVRMYLTQMGEIPLLTREQEIALAKKIEIT